MNRSETSVGREKASADRLRAALHDVVDAALDWIGDLAVSAESSVPAPGPVSPAPDLPS